MLQNRESQIVWSLSPEEVAEKLDSRLDDGLSSEEARHRLEQYGPNRLREAARRGPWRMFFSQFADVMIVLLAAAAVISALIGEITDAALIGVIVAANAVIGFVQEWRAERAVEALRALAQPTARVRRDGRIAEVPAGEIVPGDLIEISAGDFVPADARLVEAAELQTDEAALTGESLPVEKSADPVSPETGLPDRTSMIFAGTTVARGSAKALVAATGMQMEVGNIATLLESAEKQLTPLQSRLAALGRKLAIAVVLIAIGIFILGVVREPYGEWTRGLFTRMLLVAVSLAVAAIPEGLPAVITVTLALGSQRMADRNAIIRRLSAVETLGSVDVICSDKTGTLTENRMVIRDMVTADEERGRESFSDDGVRRDDNPDGKRLPTPSRQAERLLLTAGVLCNDAEIAQDGEPIGSPTETAFLRAALERGMDPAELRRTWRRLDEIPFSSERKRMTTLNVSPRGEHWAFVKGAAEAVIDDCTLVGTLESQRELTEEQRRQWNERAEELAGRGRRVLAVAARRWEGEKLSEPDAEPDGLCLLGLVGIVDPPREEAADSIARCRSAGIRPVMITGDHPGTARTIAAELDIFREGDRVLRGTDLDHLDQEELNEAAPQTAVYARVSPEHKLKIVRAYQSHGSVVSMTGDGVNDAPALGQADIGVAMGIAGTDVARESAEMILADDNFATIVAAVEEGRVVYDNIRKFVRYLLTANTGEIITLTVAIVLGMPLPLLPVHILWINLVTDGLPALSLGFEPPEADVMQRPPRKRDESVFAGGMAWGIVLIGALMGGLCVVLFWCYLPGGPLQASVRDAPPDAEVYARSLVFTTLSMFQLFYVLAIRSERRSFFAMNPLSNYRLIVSVLIGGALQMAVIYVPLLQSYFHTTALSARDLLIGLAVSTTAFFAVETRKLVRRLRERRS